MLQLLSCFSNKAARHAGRFLLERRRCRPRLRHEAIFLLAFALDLVNMFIATVAYPALAAELHADVGTLAWWAPPTCWA